jgi:lipooligosaccharide transport system permease protein
VVKLSPLYHGNELLRGFTLGMVDWTMVGHAAFLVIMGVVSAAIASRRLDSMLRK